MEAREGQLEEVFQSPENTVVVHYSCESFFDRTDPHSPRITSIAVRNLDSGQTRSFPIHLVAERRGLLGNIEQHYDELEIFMPPTELNFIGSGSAAAL